MPGLSADLGGLGFSLCAEVRFGLKRFGALLIDIGFFAVRDITPCETLDVALQLIRFGAFLCHNSPFDTKPMNFRFGYLPK